MSLTVETGERQQKKMETKTADNISSTTTAIQILNAQF